MGDHVFICYAREDSEFVLKLVANLKNRRVPVWLDQWNIRPSEDWDLAIDNAIDECAHFLIILSPDAVASREVRGELRRALDKDKPITPALYRSCAIPRQLLTVQYADFTSSDPTDTGAIGHLIHSLGEQQKQRPPDFTQPEPFAASGREIYHLHPSSALSEIIDSIGMKFVLIPAGEFLMGAEEGVDHEKPVHRVQISQPFYLGKYPVTQGQWQVVMRNNPSHFAGDLNRPVENVSWNDIQEFFQKLSIPKGGKVYRLENMSPNEVQEFSRTLGESGKGSLYRLPTEAEWEYACRAGSTGAYCFGDDEAKLKEYAWYDENSRGTTHPVGQLKPNKWGLYDMHGNVCEWVQDWYANDYYKQRPTLDIDPQGPETGEVRVMRGGSYLGYQRHVCCAYRNWTISSRNEDIGFRVVVRP